LVVSILLSNLNLVRSKGINQLKYRSLGGCSSHEFSKDFITTLNTIQFHVSVA
jgi:hypothetical protein